MIKILLSIFIITASGCSVLSGQLEQPFTPELKSEILSEIDSTLKKEAFSYGTDFNQWRDHLAQHQTEIDAAPNEEELAKAINNAFDEFKISHLSIQPPRAVELSNQGLITSERIGLRCFSADDQCVVDQIIKASPAYIAGIRRGDNITELNLLEENEGSNNEHKVYSVAWTRNDQKHSATITATTFKRVDPMELLWLADDIPVLRFGSFTDEFYAIGTSNALIKKVVERSPQALIIDMRGNEGGDGINFHHFVSHFNKNFTTSILAASKKDLLAAQKVPPQNPSYESVMDEGFHIPSLRVNPFRSRFKGTIIILIDHLAASAGDLVPQILRETRGAVLIGRTTSGYLLGAEEKILPGGFRLNYPAWEVTPPSATRLEKTGVKPDIELSVQETATDAIIYTVAVDEIKRQLNIKNNTSVKNH